MIRLAAVLALIASPALADPFMTQDQCDGAWLRSVGIGYGMIPGIFVNDLVTNRRNVAEAVKTQRTTDGWCRIDAQQVGMEAANFAHVDWRARDIDRFINSNGVPSRIEERFFDVTIENGTGYQIDLGVQHEPDAGLLLIENLVIAAPDGANISASGVIGGAFFRDIGQAGMSLGGLHLDRVSAVGEVSPALVADLVPDITEAALKEGISDLSFAQLDRSSKRAVMAFAGDLPNARGDLTVDFRSERGLNWMQTSMAATREGAEAVAFALSGASVTVDWQPK